MDNGCMTKRKETHMKLEMSPPELATIAATHH
jgi:hypothetical protein